MTPRLSIVIPAYNEASRIGPTLEAITRFAGERPGTEVIVVDDGSTDDTFGAARAVECPGLRVIRTEVNRGKGHAVRTGMLAANGSFRLLTDADGSTPITELPTLEAALARQGDRGVAFGSIAVADADVVRRQSGLRPAAGRLGNLLIRMLVLPGIRDSQRGFKLLSGEAADAIFSRCRVDRWGMDVEVLALARHLGYPIAEVPVRWEHKEDSRVTALSYLTTLSDVVKVRWRLGRGTYDREQGPASKST